MKVWSKKELEKQVKDKRKLKLLRQRKPEGVVSFKELSKKVAERSEFQIKQVDEVLEALVAVVEECMDNRELVKLSTLGSFYPSVKRARQGTNLQGGKSAEQMIQPPRWEMNFMKNLHMVEHMKNQEVTQKDIDNLYT